MEAQTTLVWANGAVKLHAVADVDLHFTLVVHPWYSEGDDALRLHHALHDFCFLKLGMLVVDVLY